MYGMDEKIVHNAKKIQNTDFIYGLEDKVPLGKSVVYGLQHLIAFLASAVVMPVVVGTALGLDQQAIAEFLQRTFIFGGVAGILQAKFGHKYPLVDGPSGLWTGLLVLIAASITAQGKPIELLRTDLEMGMLIAGVVLILLCVFRLVTHISKLFTPLVNGVIIMLMTLQLSPSMVKGMTGISENGSYLDWRYVVVAIVTVVCALGINLKAKGFIQSIATLLGVIVGWILAVILGITKDIHMVEGKFVTLPEPFAYGTPTFDAGVVIICVIGSLVLLSMVFTGVSGMSEALEIPVDRKKFTTTTLIQGIMTIGSGIWPVIGPMPYISSVGILLMTRVAAVWPFIVGCIMMIILGVLAPVGALFASMPIAVGYAALLIVFALIFGQGIKEFRKLNFTNRESYIIGISLLVGIGIMFLPASAFTALPGVIGYILSNGLIVGTILVLLLEHVLIRKK
ncbi:MAG: xanthine permease [Clostridiales bacterium]|nr:xanthine permease [Clostridiales bacterium]